MSSNKLRNGILFVLFAWVSSVSCNEKGRTEANKADLKLIDAPAFEGDSAMANIEQQLLFGPRVPGTAAHKACADWLVERLKKYGAIVSEQTGIMPYLGDEEMSIKNIIASFQIENKNRVLLCAHYDTRYMADRDSLDTNTPISGANDGASGVAVLLELARLISLKSPEIGIDIVLFDAEDQGRPEFPVDTINPEHYFCLGSRYWAKNPHVPNYSARYGVLLDMVGGKNALFTLEYSSMQAAPGPMTKMWDIAALAGFGERFSQRKTRPIINDHTYINEQGRIPTFVVIEFDPGTATNFNLNWHTQGDNVDNVSAATLKAVGQTLTHLVYNER